MKSLVPPAVHVVSLVAAVAITTLVVGIHAADLSRLGAHDIVVAGAPLSVASVAAAPSRR